MRLLLCLLTVSLSASAQNREIDSLKKVLQTQAEDSARVNTLNQLNRAYWQTGDFNKCLESGLSTALLARRLGYERGFATACGNIGVAYRHMGNYTRALEYYFTALKIDERLKDSAGLAKRLNNIGLVFLELGNREKALEHYTRALRIDEALGNEKGRATRLANIGSVYDNFNRAKALVYYQQALEIDERIGNPSGIARDNGNLGNLYAFIGDSAEAQGNGAAARRNYERAEKYFSNALSIYEELGDQDGIATYTGNLGLCRMTRQDYAGAERLIKNAMRIARSISALNLVKDHEQFLSEVYSKAGRHQLALEHYKNYIQVRDSIFNEEQTKQQVRAEMNYEFDKKEASARLEQEKKEAVAAADAKRQRIILLAVSGLGVLVLGFALFAYRSFLQKKRANHEITRQKHLIEEKQREILDSIHYAKRIQQSLMPSEKYLARLLGETRT
jgi:tetratricopeptide (TPR) repeat protein